VQYTLYNSGFVDDVMFVHNGANGSESYVSSSSPGGDTGDDCKLVAAGGNKVQNIKPRNVRNYTS